MNMTKYFMMMMMMMKPHSLRNTKHKFPSQKYAV